MPGTAQATPPAANAKQAPPPALRPFFTGTLDLETHTYSQSVTLTTTAQPLPTYYPKTNGFLADLWIRIQATGAGTGGTVATNPSPDGVASYLSVIQLSDTGGQPVLGPMTGEEFLIFVKWGGFSFSDDPRASETFSELVVASGVGTLTLHIPIQFVRAEALGPLPNTNSNNALALDITVAGSGTLFTVAPSAPAVTVGVQVYQDAYRQSAGKDAQQNPTVITPPGLGAVLYARRNTTPVNAGSQDIQLSQQEGSYRAMNFIFKDSNSNRTQAETDWPSPLQVYFNNDVPYDRNKDYWQRRLERDYGYTRSTGPTVAPAAALNNIGVRDLGVYTLNWITDGGSMQAGDEDRYKYLNVSAADTLGWRGTVGATTATHTLVTLYNFVRPPGGNIKGLTAR